MFSKPRKALLVWSKVNFTFSMLGCFNITQKMVSINFKKNQGFKVLNNIFKR